VRAAGGIGSEVSGSRRLALVLGSGASATLGLPTTTQLGERLLTKPNGIELWPDIEDFISDRIADYWSTVFGWSHNKPKPTLEDHFTQLDLAANSGHQLGSKYDPKQLRAIRRMTIHRVFTLLRSPGWQVDCVYRFFKALVDNFDVTVITTNWDSEAESYLGLLNIPFTFGLDEVTLDGRRPPSDGVLISKLHGSVDWGYCDSCRTLTTFGDQTVHAVVSQRLLLEPGDFNLLGRKDLATKLGHDRTNTAVRTCGCGGRIGVRVATFSYRKDLNPHAFYTIWDKAASGLQLAKRWLFVGYSLPEADIEIRHMLKWTQLARRNASEPSIRAVLQRDRGAAERYQRFFGISESNVFQCGFEGWISEHFDRFCDSE